jgi:hypothetical protein
LVYLAHLVSKRGHKYVTFGEEGVTRNSDMSQVMYGNYVREHKAACRMVALLCLKSWEKTNGVNGYCAASCPVFRERSVQGLS